MRLGPLACALSLAMLAGCADWNEKKTEFATHAEFAASDLALRNQVPRDLVPPSARNLKYVRNIDTTEVRLDFDFDPTDEREVLRPFLSVSMKVHETLVAEGSAPASVVSAPRMEVRCGTGAVEFLRITEHRHASYWTSWDPEIRANSCDKPVGTPKPRDTPTQAAVTQ